jgi:hypothetical protein
MRSWHTVERHLRHDVLHALTAPAGAVAPPVVVTVGAFRPEATITVGGFNPDRPSQTLAELALLAVNFCPDRVLVATALPDGRGRRRGATFSRGGPPHPAGVPSV